MTKTEEIAALQQFVGSLPQNSYLWPWLTEVMGEVMADIRNDVMIAPSIRDTRQRCEAMREEARQHAEQIVSAAKAEAQRIQQDARHTVAMTRDELANLARRIEHMAQE